MRSRLLGSLQAWTKNEQTQTVKAKKRVRGSAY